jgi:hypothetical protein
MTTFPTSKKENKIDRILEAYRRSPSFYKTFSGHFKLRDEPDEDKQFKQSDQIRMALQQRMSLASRNRLKSQSKVPTRKGKPIFDHHQLEVNEDISKVLMHIRTMYYSGKLMTFKQFLHSISDMVDDVLI